MPYVDEDFYNMTFYGEPVDPADFPALCERAAEIVEEMSMYRVTEDNLATYPEATQVRFKKAVCAQIEYLDANGGSELDTGAGGMQSAVLGKFNYTLGAGSGADGSTGQSIYAPRALRYLAPTGLLYRGGGC